MPHSSSRSFREVNKNIIMVGESRTELINWLNQTLLLEYQKVEQCGNGAAYCQLLDCVYQDIPMNRVNFEAKSEFDCSTNMKILQAAFQRHGITKIIDVDRIMKCRLQDNLELLQWFKKHWMERKDLNVEYDPVMRRKRGTSGVRRPSSANGGATIGTRPLGSRVSSRTPSGTTPKAAIPKVGSRALSGSKSPVNASKTTTPITRVSSGSGAVNGGTSAASAALNAKIGQLTKELADTKDQIDTLTNELSQTTMELDTVQVERNFFFQKLVDIESLVDSVKSPLEETDPLFKLADQVSEILIATEEGFSSVNDDEMEITEKFNIEAESF